MANDKNSVELSGVLARTPEARTFGSGSRKATFTVIVRREFEKDGETKEGRTYVDCEAWNDLCDVAAELAKDQEVSVHGSIKVDSWEDKDTGKKRYKQLVNVFGLKAGTASDKKPARKVTAGANIGKPPPDDDVPFDSAFPVY